MPLSHWPGILQPVPNEGVTGGCWQRGTLAQPLEASLCHEEWTLALAAALRKISANPGLGNVYREDIAQMYIIRPKSMANSLMERINALSSTHPSTERRIQLLEQF